VEKCCERFGACGVRMTGAIMSAKIPGSEGMLLIQSCETL
jgi:hypothetical protein